MEIKYHTNNSGGSWWLKDKDWKSLEKGGWNVEWVKDSDNVFSKGQERLLGALAHYASKDFEIVSDAITDFEELTGVDVSDDGCSCCGPPHSFNWKTNKGEYQYASGEELLEYMYPNKDVNKTKRQLLEGE